MAGSTSGAGAFPRADNVWQTLEQLASEVERRLGARASTAGSRGDSGPSGDDVRSAVLRLLAERPMRGHEIIREIEERSGGRWKPTAGAVYPTLQQLVDEGLVSAAESEGRKLYTLTEAGRGHLLAAGDAAPWDRQWGSTGGRSASLSRSGFELAQAAAVVARSGSREQLEQAAGALDDARRRLYSILAQS